MMCGKRSHVCKTWNFGVMAMNSSTDTQTGQLPEGLNGCAVCNSGKSLKRCTKCMSVACCCKKHKKKCKPESHNSANKESEKDQINNSVLRTLPGKETAADSKQNTCVDLSCEFDKRPYSPRQFPKPSAKDRDTLAVHIVSQLKRNFYCVVDDVFNPKFARGICVEVTSLYSSGIFVDGQLSSGKTSSISPQMVTHKTIRGDKITWLQGNEKEFPYVCHLVKTLDGILVLMNTHLEGECVVGGRTKAMVACYPGNGTGYACHVDNPNRDGRSITCLYYLNEGWDAKKQGGLLRIFPKSGDFVDVEPVLNRVIFFWSDRRNPHEVQPAFDARYAITLWYFDKQEREEAKQMLERQSAEDMNKLQQQYALMDMKTKQAEKVDLDNHIQ